jgi:ribosomal protein L23
MAQLLKTFNHLLSLFKYPNISEKSLQTRTSLTLIGNRSLTKIDIKKVLEPVLQIKILKINTQILPPKNGKPCYKKIIIRYKSENII